MDSWISRLKRMLEEFRISKVVEIVPGGATAWDSIFAGLGCATKYFSGESVVLIHDAVRPMIDSGTIDSNIETVKRYGSCITCYPMTENIMGNRPNGMTAISDPGELLIVRAPQSFFLNKIMAVYEKSPSGRERSFPGLLFDDESLRGAIADSDRPGRKYKNHLSIGFSYV